MTAAAATVAFVGAGAAAQQSPGNYLEATPDGGGREVEEPTPLPFGGNEIGPPRPFRIPQIEPAVPGPVPIPEVEPVPPGPVPIPEAQLGGPAHPPLYGARPRSQD